MSGRWRKPAPSGHGPSLSVVLDSRLTAWLTACRAHPLVQGDGLGAAGGLARMAGLADRVTLTVTSDPYVVASRIGLDAASVLRGVRQLRAAGFVHESNGVLVLAGGER